MVDLKDYIQNSIEKIKGGLGEKAKVSGNVVLEITTTTKANSGAGISIQVVELGAKLSAEETQKITIPITILTDLEKAKELAEIA